MNHEEKEQHARKKNGQETLEISSTGYGFESVSAANDWGNNISAQKQNDTESS